MNFQTNIEKEQRVLPLCESWLRTPYLSGQRVKGIGVDCINFVCSIVDELRGEENKICPIPPDTAFHDPDKALEALALILRRYPHSKVSLTDEVESGDILVTGPKGGPSHVMIVGAPNMIFHANPPFVSRTGFLHKAGNYLRVIRPCF